jgi:hypothetical protein
MEVLTILFGGCCAIPIAILLTILFLFAYDDKRVSKRTLLLVLGMMWGAIALATASELWWMYVEEPQRIEAGETI